MGDYEERARKPAAKPIEQSGHKEASWVQPNTSSSGTHVGSIFFRTKDHSIDARDRQLLDSLAGAYARYAERDKGKHTGAPVTANIVGYADPRPSHAPNNESLSDARATTVAGALDQAFAHSGIDKTLGFARTDHAGAGVDPAAPTGHEDSVEANVLAPFRRADIFVHGKAEPTVDSVAPNVDTSGIKEKPPDYTARRHDFDRYKYYVELCDKRSIAAIATQILNGFTDDQVVDALLAWSTVGAKPAWWDSRDSGPVEPMGRGGPPVHGNSGPTTPPLSAGDQILVDKARRLLADYRLYSLYALEHEADAQHRYINSGKEDRDAARTLGEIGFMLITVRVEAEEVRRLAR